MGQDKTTTQNSQTATATPEEKQLEQLQLGQAQAFDPQQRQLNQNAGSLINSLLQGQSLPGYLNQLPGGISPDVIDTNVKQSLLDIAPQFQQAGILDSGSAAQIASRTAADIRTQASQFNLQNLQQLLNLAVGGQSQIQQPILQNNSTLSSSLAGLRSINSSGSTIGMNPFLKSFQTGLGQSLGSGTYGSQGGNTTAMGSKIFG